MSIIGAAEREFDFYNEAPKGKSELGKEDYLTLLLAQLQNQDPLNPMDDKELTSELANFSQLEQLMQINTGIETLAVNDDRQNMSDASNLIDKEVRAVGDSLSIHEDSTVSAMYYHLETEAKTVYINIYDTNNNTVRQIEIDGQGAGEHEYQWDGKNDNGDVLPEGVYHVAMGALDEEDNPILTQIDVAGKVEAVVSNNGMPYLRLTDGRFVSYDNVYEILQSGII